jgi:hypothetical protein
MSSISLSIYRVSIAGVSIKELSAYIRRDMLINFFGEMR